MTDAQDGSGTEEQALLVYLRLSDDEFGSETERDAIERVEDVLREALVSREVGEFDGNEVGEGYYKLFLYGASAERLADVALPLLHDLVQLLPGSYYIKRYGAPGSEQDQVPL